MIAVATKSEDVRLRTFPASEWRKYSAKWSQLAAAVSASFFLSSEWIEVWLETFGSMLDTNLLMFEVGSLTIGAMLISCSKRGIKVFPIRRYSLNAAGEESADTTYTEYNSALCLPGWETQVAESFAKHLETLRWDELAVDGFVDGLFLKTLCQQLSHLKCEEVRHPSYFVDLAAIRQADGIYENVLSSSRRKHLRQQLRYYSESGPLEFSIANDLTEALSMFKELGKLSEARSAELGRRGIFASAHFVKFHQELIERCQSNGGVKLMRLTASDQTVGILYNLISQGRVYFYQCGFNYGGDKRLSPGTVTLSFAIQHFIDSGLDDYDFLSGEAKYKERLSTGARELAWMLWRRPTVRSSVFTHLRDIQRRMNGKQGQQ